MSGTFPDRRHLRRSSLKLSGRYMLSDGFEFHCQTIDVSATGARIQADVVADIGERVVAYLDKLGRIEGRVVRCGTDWFAFEVRTSPARIERIAQKIAELNGDNFEPLVEQTTPPKKRLATLQLAFGQVYTLYVCDETSFGAKVLASFKLLPGAKVAIDGRPAIVEHDASDGFSVVFARQ